MNKDLVPQPVAGPLGRRLLSRAAIAGTGAVALGISPLTEGAAEAAISWRPARYRRTRILDRRSWHIVQRFTGGWTPALRNEINRAGGIDAWFGKQLNPRSLPDRFYNGSKDWWLSNTASPETIWERRQNGVETIWDANANYQRWTLARRIHSERQVLETMANFWEHHFHVPTDVTVSGIFRPGYGRMIRANALGRFDTLLRRAITHPAMGSYLGNAASTKKAPNENLGRELLELHTVGRDSGYTETDVKNSARILTGYRVDLWKTWAVSYDPASHWTGPVTVLGFSRQNSDPDGRAVANAYLRYLAHHPATARTIARKLAVHFVSDHPSDALVAHLASVYLSSGTAIAPVLRALVNSREFRSRVGAKVRTPEEDVIATYRALGARITAPHRDDSAANAILWQAGKIGLLPFGWPRPDGRPDTADAWTSGTRMLASFELHVNASGTWYPKNDIRYHSAKSWLPQSSIRFDRFIDHLARRITGRPSSSALLHAASQATGTGRYETITAGHPLILYRMPRLLTVFLDNPTHFRR